MSLEGSDTKKECYVADSAFRFYPNNKVKLESKLVKTNHKYSEKLDSFNV